MYIVGMEATHMENTRLQSHYFRITIISTKECKVVSTMEEARKFREAVMHTFQDEKMNFELVEVIERECLSW